MIPLILFVLASVPVLAQEPPASTEAQKPAPSSEQINPQPGNPASVDAPGTNSGSAPPETTGETPEAEKKAKEALETQEQPKKAAPAEAEQAQAMLGEGRLQLEYSMMYAHFSTDQLIIDGFSILPILIIGDITVEKVRRDIFIHTVAARYKLFKALQIEVRIPYTFLFSRASEATGTATTASPNKETVASSSGLGDIETSLSYQLLQERLSFPAILVGIGFKARTGRDIFQTKDPIADPPIGSGYNSVIGTVSLVKTSDPAVVFGSVSYAYAVPRKNVVFRPKDDDPYLIDYSPGDSIRFGLGLAYALNFRLTLGFQYQQAITLSSHIDGRQSPNSFGNAISLRLGAVWRLNDRVSIDVGMSPGFSDAPDFRLDLRVPYRF